ncbi:uncharacterized protein LOC105189628 isoform X1 [Harpegnathos saltator]|uniref:uncharacterized protein LOC105189628 isoform X1 n=1 Tax=Harpegnathos saltator TaxID=610380 RepID=UPI00058BFB27|nr:uncharacterized protein LOC105189628 isoform X1 [Harpegnathos saltator]
MSEYIEPQTHTDFTLRTEYDKTYYANECLPQFQKIASTANTQQNISQQQEEYMYAEEVPVQKENTKTRKMEERLANLELEVKKMNGTLMKILKCAQDRYSAVEIPQGLPISTLEQIDAFENQDDERYSQVQIDGRMNQRFTADWCQLLVHCARILTAESGNII